MTTRVGQLPAATSIATTDYIPVEQGGVLKRANPTLLPFVQSGTAPTSRSVQDVLRAMVRTGDYASSANYDTNLEALTEGIGVAYLETQDESGIKLQTQGQPFVVSSYSALFNSVRDDVFFIAYNRVLGSSTKVNSSEPMLTVAMEANFKAADTNNYMEINIDYTSSDGLTQRRFYDLDINRATHIAHHQWCGSTFTLSQVINSNPSIYFDLSMTSTKRVGYRFAGGSNTEYQIGGNSSDNAPTQITIGPQAISGDAFEIRISTTYLGLAGVVSPQILFLPSSGATKNAGIYQNSNILRISEFGVADRVQIDIGTGNISVGSAATSATSALVTPAGTTGVASLRVPHGSAPTSPVNGDIWTTTSGLFVRINGSTVGPLT